jgi:signal transduction histidine kinase
MELVLDYRASPDRPADRVERERLEQLAACFQLFVGHELPNMLVSIQGFARLLAGSTARLDDESRLLLDRIAALTRKADLASRRLAEIGRILREPAGGEPIDLAELVREVLAEVNARLDGRPLGLRLDGPSARVALARPLLAAVVAQVLTNAAQAAPAEGLRSAAIHITPEPAGVWLSVRDEGRGLSDAQRPLLEEPFASGRQTGATGTGLGFFLVRQAAARWGGVVRVASAPGRGTTVELFLPATAEGHAR